MRLADTTIQTIREVVAEFDVSARVYLFGSRVDDSARGGDLDLMVLTSRLNPAQGWDIEDALMDRLGEQRIDVVVTPSPSTPFQRIVFEKAVPL